MSLSDQTRSLSRAGAEMRQEAQGTDDAGNPLILDYDNGAQSPRGYWSPVRNQQQLDDSGMHGQHDTIARIIKTNFTGVPVIGKVLGLPLPQGGIQRVKISEFGNYGIGAEWVLGCSAI